MPGKLFVCICVCLLLCGCSPGAVFESPLSSSGPALPVKAEVVSPELLKLPVNLRDSLNPYRLGSQVNKSAAALLYDGLYSLTPDYNARPVLALDGGMEGAIWRIRLKPGALFSDGAPISARDVVYSFQLASADSSPYHEQLRQVQSCYADGESVVFTLMRPNRLFLNNLTFPVLKSGTGNMDTPVGSGRFVVEQADSGGFILKPGPDAGRCGPIREVRLIAMSVSADIASALKIGVVDMLQSIQSSHEDIFARMNTLPLDLNALTFLALNEANAALADDAVRRAIYLSIDRDDLAQFSYGSKAQPAYTPFNPAVDWLPDAEFVGRGGHSRALVLLEEAGYLPGSDDVRLGSGGELRFSLLVNSDNSTRLSAAQRLSEQLLRVGIEITLFAKPYEEYKADYDTKRYDLCLVEMQLCDDMTLDLALPGITSGGLEESYTDFLLDTSKADAFLAEFLEQNPFIPLVYRYGTLASTRNFSAGIVATKWDIFYNMSDW